MKPAPDYNELVAIRVAEPGFVAGAEERGRAISDNLKQVAMQLENFHRQARREEKAARKIVWLRRAADLVGSAAQGIAPCKDGCAHCCHMPVMLTSDEARVIARETGKKLNADVVFSAEANMAYLNTPCPMLKDNRCSIYAYRPHACRTHVAVDRDALLCQLAPDADAEPIHAPYLDVSAWHANYLLTLGRERLKLADIRDFFGNDE